MARRLVRRLAGALVLWCGVGPHGCLAAEPLEAAVAVVDITPPVGYRLSGYFYERVSTGVRDPLQAKALVLRQGDVSAAIVLCDLVGVPSSAAGEARRQASEATGIPADNIAVAATHSHTGPLYFGALRDHFHRRAVDRLGADPHEKVDYHAELVAKFAAAIGEAHHKLAPVDLAAGFAREERLSFNRRFHMKDGSVRFNPGNQNPDIVRAAGPIDPQVGMVALRRPGQPQPFAALAAFALHLDTLGGTEYSADYPRFAEDALRQALGGDFQLLFAAGTCGDVNHVDVRQPANRKAPEIGAMLAETLAAALKPESESLSTIAEPSLAVRSGKVAAALQKYSPEEVDKALGQMDLIGGRELPFLEQVRTYKIAGLQAYKAPTLPLEVQAIRLSDDVALVTLPAEVFVELGLAIKAASPFKTTIVIELANESIGYIPTRKAFAEGSYETVNSRIEPGTGEQLVELAGSLLDELK